MPAQAIPAYLRWRVLDNNTGAVLIPDLPHLHRSQIKVLALQQGYPGASSLGEFSIAIAAPQSDEFRRVQYLFAELSTNLRVEAFLGDVITGDPVFSGIITKISRHADGWTVTGMDSLYMLERSQLFPGEALGAGGTALTLVNIASGTPEVVWDDDFSGGLGSYTNSGWSTTTADPQFALPGLQTTTPFSRAVTTTTWNAASQYQWTSPIATTARACMITAQGTMVAGTDTAAAMTAEVLFLSDSTWANGYMGRALMKQTGVGTGVYTVDAEIWSTVGGVQTLRASAANIFGNPITGTLAFEVKVVVYSLGQNYTVKLWVNGRDSNCVWAFTSAPFASGGIGVRSAWNAGGSPACYVNRLNFQSRTSPTWGTKRFGAGTQVATGRILGQTIFSSNQSCLDVMMLASSMDGFFIRKNPGYGYKSDTIDYSSSPGTDLSASIVLEEGVNIDLANSELSYVADALATDVRLNAIPGNDSGGNFTWSKLASIGDAVLMATASDIGIPGYTLLAQYARIVQARKSEPSQALQVSFVRTSTACAPELFRELDFVTVNIPSYGIVGQVSQVIGYVLVEGDVNQTIFLGQLPARQFIRFLLDRVARPIEYMSTTYLQRG